MKTLNKQSTKSRFFKEICGEMTRISKKEYDFLYDASDGVSCLFTEDLTKIFRFYTTLIFEDLHFPKRVLY